jgi:predicted thioesterase
MQSTISAIHFTAIRMAMVGRASLQVAAQHLAPAMRTGAAKVMSTAILLAVMEEAACNAIASECSRTNRVSVGTRMNLVHKRPSVTGASVVAVASVDKIDRKSVHFVIEATDETGIVGTGDHTRAFVNQQEFEQRAFAAARRVTP